MRESGRLSGAIEVLEEFYSRPAPIKKILSEWGRTHRFAGSKDRAWISDLCHDVLRKKRTFAHAMREDSPRAACLAALRFGWGWSLEHISETAAEQPYGPGQLTDGENKVLTPAHIPTSDDPLISGNFPSWLSETRLPSLFDMAQEGLAMSERAGVDLRVNTLKSTSEKACKALAMANAARCSFSETALRIEADQAAHRGKNLESFPAWQKGWVEVQDLGSQLAALAAGKVEGKQVLDYCAGGGGKTLALAAMSQNSGQVFAWDADGKRLAPIFDRMKRAGTRNVQVRSPADGGNLRDLTGRMDVVFVDAPCSGSGTWRRKPDTKWRLTRAQLEDRMLQQKNVLHSAQEFVKPGGRLVYVTCSILPEENDDRVAEFLEGHDNFELEDVASAIAESGIVTADAADILATKCRTKYGVQLTPARTETDGFFISTLRRQAD